MERASAVLVEWHLGGEGGEQARAFVAFKRDVRLLKIRIF